MKTITKKELIAQLDSLCGNPESPLVFYRFLPGGKILLEADLKIPGIRLQSQILGVSTVKKQLREKMLLVKESSTFVSEEKKFLSLKEFLIGKIFWFLKKYL